MENLSFLRLEHQISRFLQEAERKLRAVSSKALPNGSTLLSEIEAIRENLNGWRDLWLDEDSPEDAHLEAIWGHSAIDNVQGILHSLLKTSEALDTSVLALRTKLSKPSTRWTLLAWRASGNQASFSNKKEFLKTQEYVKQLGGQVEYLQAASETYLRAHQIAVIPQRSAGANARNRLRQIEAARKPLVALYRWFSQFDDSLSLRMDLFDDENDKLCCHLFLDHSGTEVKTEELVIELIDDVDPGQLERVLTIGLNPARSRGSIDQTIAFNDSEDFHLRYVGSGPSRPFRVRTVSGSEESEVRQDSLSRLLGKVDDSILFGIGDRMSLADKIELAFKIAECGLWLVGTPWLSSLNSERLQRRTSPNQKDHYVLPIQLSPLNDSPDDMASTISRSGQIWSIGVLLAEIALDAPFDMNLRRPGLDVNARIMERIGEIEMAMGHRYGRAVHYCLRSIQTRSNSWYIPASEEAENSNVRNEHDPDEDDEHEGFTHFPRVLQDYYENVYTGYVCDWS
jgi:hypothetical protein